MAAKKFWEPGSQCELLNLFTTYSCELQSSHEASALPKANGSMLSFVGKKIQEHNAHSSYYSASD